MNRTFFALVALALLVGCSTTPEPPACTPGRVESCPCGGGRTGIQMCLADGTFDACFCEGIDLGGPDANMSDAGVDLGDDAGTELDAGFDASTPDAGPIHGHAVALAGEALVADDAVDRELTNSVFLSERSGPLAILEYTQSIDTGGWDPRARTRALIDAEATARSRTVSYTDLHFATDLATMLPAADVLLIYAQLLGSPGAMQGIGDSWHDTLDAFLDAGGVIIVLTSRDVRNEWRLVSGAGLFNSLTDPPSFARENVEVVMPTDPVVLGVLSPYPPPSVDGATCFPGISGGVTVARTMVTATMLPSLCPTVQHLTR